MFTYTRTHNADSDFVALVRELDIDLNTRYGRLQSEYDQYNVLAPLDAVVVAYDGTNPVGCGSFKKFDDKTVEIKRMFVSPEKRNAGIAANVLTELENWAREIGCTRTVLEMGDAQPEASRLYNKMGYIVTKNFPPYIGMPHSICLEKHL